MGADNIITLVGLIVVIGLLALVMLLPGVGTVVGGLAVTVCVAWLLYSVVKDFRPKQP